VWSDQFEGRIGEVSKAIPADTLEFIQSSLPSTWIPLERDRHVIRAIIEVHGEAGAQRCWREMMVEHTNTPLLRGVVRTSRTLFGATPGSVAKMAPKAWQHVYRDVCKLTLLSRSDRDAVLRVSEPCPELEQEPGYYLCFASVIAGISDRFGGAEVQIHRSAGIVDLEMTWNHAKST
jgi:hypothetical protein